MTDGGFDLNAWASARRCWIAAQESDDPMTKDALARASAKYMTKCFGLAAGVGRARQPVE